MPGEVRRTLKTCRPDYSEEMLCAWPQTTLGRAFGRRQWEPGGRDERDQVTLKPPAAGW